MVTELKEEVEQKEDKPPAGFVRLKAPKTSAKTSQSSTSNRGRKKNLTPKLEDFFTSIGTMVYALNATDGAAILEGTPDLARSLNNLANEDERVRRMLERMLTGSAYGGVFMATAAILLPILANHNLLPVQLPGHMMPESAPKEELNGG